MLIQLTEWTGKIAKAIFAVSLGSIVGLIVIQFIAGWIVLFVKSEWLVNYYRVIGWCLGAVIATFWFPKIFRKKLWKPRNDDEPQDETESEQPSFQKPSFAGFVKSSLLFSVIGAFLGFLLSLYFATVLISVTSSPFVPDSWRPGFESVGTSDEDLELETESNSQEAGVGVEFSHPCLGPLILATVILMAIVGVITGMVFSFYPGDIKSRINRRR